MTDQSPPIKAQKTNEMHDAATKELVVWAKKYGAEMQAQELLALAANMVGRIMALQDGRWMTPDMANELISSNIESGNRAMCALIAKTAGEA